MPGIFSLWVLVFRKKRQWLILLVLIALLSLAPHLKVYQIAMLLRSVIESNEAIRCEYISAILHACINIVRELTEKKISLNLQFEPIQSFLRPVPLTDLIPLVVYKMLYNAKVLSKLIRENERRMMLSVKNMTISSGS